MFKNYLKITVRNLFRNKSVSIINIFGLAVGLACTILITMWIFDEMSYDSFHKNADNIYLVLRGDNSDLTALSSKLLAPALKEELPEISEATRYMPIPASIKILMQNDESGFEENFGLADTNFFKIFSFQMLEGNSTKVLTDPNSVVITKQIAEKYFGKENAFGRTLAVTLFGIKQFMKINGVIENIPPNSHIKSQIIFPVNMLQTFGAKENGWGDLTFETYIQLKNPLIKSSDIQNLSSQVKECELANSSRRNKTLQYSLMPLRDIHLYGNGIKFLETTGDINNIKIFIAIAIIILLIACINYMNLSTALSLKRTKEVGIKKTIGADKKSLLIQFFTESIVMSLIALVFAILLIELFLPGFNQLTGKKLVLGYSEPYFISSLLLLAIFTGLLSGCYPALFLSSFQPIQVLKGKLKIGAGNLITRKGLVIFQFSLSIIIIISTIVVFNQLNFIRNSKLGFDKENIICINMTGDVNSNYRILKDGIRRIPGVISTSRSESITTSGLSATGVLYRKGSESNSEANSWVVYTDFDLISTYKFQMQHGRFYSENFQTDKTSAFVVNEAAAKAMRMKSPLGENIYLRGRLGKIIGVTKDFHFASFHNTIEPLVFMIPDSSQENGRFRIISVRYKSGEPGKILSSIENIWKDKLPSIPFNYYFYDESLNAQYNSEQRTETIFTYFSFLSILLACLGLLGLASLSAEQRTKEIGIRKVLGASISNVTFILSKEFLNLVLISNVAAWPIAYYFMNKWLQNFAYRIEISWWMFVLAGGIALVIALATVSFQAIKAATANPVESLRYE